MEKATTINITVEALIKAPVEKVWTLWTDPKHITKWCQASDDWHAPYSDNDLRINGKFKTTMAAKDESMRFDFEGVYTSILQHQVIEFTMDDGRKVKVTFSGSGRDTEVIETFEPETTNAVELQREGWQAILNNFKKYVETNS